jgi:hypothetical protein
VCVGLVEIIKIVIFILVQNDTFPVGVDIYEYAVRKSAEKLRRQKGQTNHYEGLRRADRVTWMGV